MSNTYPDDTACSLRIPGLELHEKIGEGGMSVVYKALHSNLHREVAVKVIRAAKVRPCRPGCASRD
jgi:serine/threonine protein kinase